MWESYASSVTEGKIATASGNESFPPKGVFWTRSSILLAAFEGLVDGAARSAAFVAANRVGAGRCMVCQQSTLVATIRKHVGYKGSFWVTNSSVEKLFK